MSDYTITIVIMFGIKLKICIPPHTRSRLLRGANLLPYLGGNPLTRLLVGADGGER
jgi:hypothetical protein